MITYHEHEVISGIKLSGTSFRWEEFAECRFEHCEFENLHMRNCKFTDCIFSKCCVTNPVFECCAMTGNDFMECRLFGINWSGLFTGFVAPIEHLEGCQLKYNSFVGVNFPKFTFSDNSILESLFADCSLSHSNFSRCHLERTEFFRCDLTGAAFQDADGYTVDISTCKLKGAVFSFPEVVNLLNGLGIIIK